MSTIPASTRSTPVLTVDGALTRHDVRGDSAEEIGKLIMSQVSEGQPWSTIEWLTASVDSTSREITVNGTSSDGQHVLVIHAAHTRGNTQQKNGALIAHTAATIASLGFGGDGNHEERYAAVLGRLIENRRTQYVFGGLTDRRTL